MISRLKKMPEAYKLPHRLMGRCIIFNQWQFDPGLKLRNRNGTGSDVRALQATWQRHGLEVVVHDDLSYEQIMRVLEDEANSPSRERENLLVVCKLSHGYQDHVYARDRSYWLAELSQWFTGDRCPGMAGKPKIFLVQACQGPNRDPGVEEPLGLALLAQPQEVGVDEEVVDQVDQDGPDPLPAIHPTIPTNSDMLMAMSSVAGCVSFRGRDGSVFMQTFCAAMRILAWDLDFLAILTIVNGLVADELFGQSGSKQSPSVTRSCEYFLTCQRS